MFNFQNFLSKIMLGVSFYINYIILTSFHSETSIF